MPAVARQWAASTRAAGAWPACAIGGARAAICRARVVIAADGRRRALAFGLGLARFARRAASAGRSAPTSPTSTGVTTRGEMHVRPTATSASRRCRQGLTNVCVVREVVPGPLDRVRAGRRSIARALCRRSRAARSVCARATGLAASSSLGPLAVEARAAGCPGLLLAGDAAGFVDPMTGDGLRFALRGGELAAEAALVELETGIPAHDRLDAGPAPGVRGQVAHQSRAARAGRVARRCPRRRSGRGPLGAAGSLSDRRRRRRPAARGS